MSDQPSDINRMLDAVGLCITAWSTVELRLAVMFRLALGCPPEMADTILATPRAFEVRALMVHNVMRVRLKDKATLDDWNLLYNYTCQLSGKRNQVAHATPVFDTDLKKAFLVPYFVMSEVDQPRLQVADLEQRAAAFQELSACLADFLLQAIPLQGHTPASGAPVPDLLLRLRKENDQRRTEQRERQKSSRP